MTGRPTWAILIPTIGQRDALFKRLLERLLPQLDEYAGAVRVLAYWNNGGPTLGEIRDSLIEAAAGADYVSFIDDDDMVPEYFVAEAMRALETRPDTIGFKVAYYVDGAFGEICDQSLRHQSWHRNAEGVLCRDITHVAPIRQTIAAAGRFARARRHRAEDRVWVKQVRPFTSTEVYVDKIMYEYLYSHEGSSWQRKNAVKPVGSRPAIDHPHFAWHEGETLTSHTPEPTPGNARAGIYRPTLRSGAWHNLLPFRIDVEASYGTFDHESGFKQDYNGFGIWKSVNDLTRYRASIVATKPEVVVETGTRWGGFAAWITGEFPGVEVITVDIDDETHPATLPGVTFVHDDSTTPGAAETVRELVAGRRCMVSLDADHHAPAVRAEIELYGPLTSPGCHLVVEDGLADIVTGRRARRLGARIPQEGGPLVAIAATLADDERFERDRSIEEMSPVSHSPAGWWLRR